MCAHTCLHTLTACEHCAFGEWGSQVGSDCWFASRYEPAWERGLFRDAVLNGCSSQKLSFSKPVSNAFYFTAFS